MRSWATSSAFGTGRTGTRSARNRTAFDGNVFEFVGDEFETVGEFFERRFVAKIGGDARGDAADGRFG